MSDWSCCCAVVVQLLCSCCAVKLTNTPAPKTELVRLRYEAINLLCAERLIVLVGCLCGSLCDSLLVSRRSGLFPSIFLAQFGLFLTILSPISQAISNLPPY